MIPWFQTRLQNVHTNNREQNQSSVLAKNQIKFDFCTNFVKMQKRMGSLIKAFYSDTWVHPGQEIKNIKSRSWYSFNPIFIYKR